MTCGVEAQHADGVDLALEVIVREYQLGDEETSMAVARRDADVASHCYCWSMLLVDVVDSTD